MKEIESALTQLIKIEYLLLRESNIMDWYWVRQYLGGITEYILTFENASVRSYITENVGG